MLNYELFSLRCDEELMNEELIKQLVIQHSKFKIRKTKTLKILKNLSTFKL